MASPGLLPVQASAVAGVNAVPQRASMKGVEPGFGNMSQATATPGDLGPSCGLQRTRQYHDLCLFPLPAGCPS